MLAITLPDGSVRSFDTAPTVYDVAHNISPSLAKNTLAGVLTQGETVKTVDASYRIEQDGDWAISVNIKK